MSWATILLAAITGLMPACRTFLPAPTQIGTFGAFIRIRSPIYTRRALFDVGVAGPLAGFVLLLPAMAIGLAYSRVIPGIAERGDLIFGVPAIQRLMEWIIFPGRCRGGHLAASGGAGGLGRNAGHGSQFASHRAVGWGAYCLFVHRNQTQAVVALVRGGAGSTRHFLLAGLAGLGGVVVLFRAAASGDF